MNNITYLQTLPQEIKRNFTLIRELDDKVEGITKKEKEEKKKILFKKKKNLKKF